MGNKIAIKLKSTNDEKQNSYNPCLCNDICTWLCF